MMMALYAANETAFTSNGLGLLGDAYDCHVVEELNGQYELMFKYPVDGLRYRDLALDCIVTAKPNLIDRAQPFRVYALEDSMAGYVDVLCQHISYDLAGIPVTPYTAQSASAAVAGLSTYAVVQNPYQFYTDIVKTGDFAIAQPVSIRAALGGADGNILSVYGGDLYFDWYDVRLYQQRGENRGVTIRYGKNLIDLKQEKNCQNTITGIMPFAIFDDVCTMLPEKVVSGSGVFPVQKIEPVDFSQNFDAAPSEAQLRAVAEDYIARQRIGVPTVSLDVSFVQLAQAEEYKQIAMLENVGVGDTVTVLFEKIGVDAQARCIASDFDPVNEKYYSLAIGEARQSLAATIVHQQETIDKVADPSYMAASAIRASQLITGNRGGYVVMHSSTGADTPDEILVMDTPDITTAVNVWRWNKNGLGYSGTGYSGTYATAITADGHIVADFIDTGSMTANVIKSGTITSHDGNFVINLDANTIAIYDSNHEWLLAYSPLNGLQIRGTIIAEYGYIGGFALDSGGLASDALTIDSETGQITFGNSGSIFGLGGSTVQSQGISLYSENALNIGAASTINFNGVGVYFNCPVYDRYGREITGAAG